MKKAKLLASIVSLCFALAVLCFGVYAAGQVNYAISGNISYEVTDAYVEVNTKVYQSDAFPDSKQKLAVVANEVAENGTIVGKHVNLLDSDTLDTLHDTVPATYEPVEEDPDFNFNERFEVNSTEYNLRSVYIVTKITNLGQNNVYAVPSVTLKSSGVAVDPAEHNVVEYMSNGYSEMEQNEEYTIILAYALSDVTKNVGELTFDYTIDIQAGDYPTASKQSALEWDNANGYWYITLGTTDGTPNGEDVYWRLYSIDGGATKYDAGVTATNNVYPEPAYPIGEGVFVQDTDLTITNIPFNNYCGEGADGEYYRKATSGGELTADLANDYFASDIYTYLTTTFVTDIGVSSSTVYTAIKTRTQADLSQSLDVSWEDDRVTFNTTNHSSKQSNKGAKFWLLSVSEAIAIIGGTPGVWNDREIGNDLQWDMDASLFGWWLRSPRSDNSWCVYTVGYGGNYNYFEVNVWEYVVRAAFELAL